MPDSAATPLLLTTIDWLAGQCGEGHGVKVDVWLRAELAEVVLREGTPADADAASRALSVAIARCLARQVALSLSLPTPPWLTEARARDFLLLTEKTVGRGSGGVRRGSLAPSEDDDGSLPRHN
jgi:hypothetical protein